MIEQQRCFEKADCSAIGLMGRRSDTKDGQRGAMGLMGCRFDNEKEN